MSPVSAPGRYEVDGSFNAATIGKSMRWATSAKETIGGGADLARWRRQSACGIDRRVAREIGDDLFGFSH